MRSWDDSRTCRATVIRDILRGRLAADPDPHGLRLRAARISGRLDLENLATDVCLELTDCLLEEGILARDARLAFVGLTRCLIEHSADPPLDADRLTCSALTLGGARIIGHAPASAVRLADAHISGPVDCTGAGLSNDCGPALDAEGLQVDQAMVLRGLTATGSSNAGAVRLPRTRIGGNLDCAKAELRNDRGPALEADGLQVDQAVFLRGLTATGTGDLGAVRLPGARIRRQVECTKASLRNDSGPALYADGLQAEQAMFLRGLTATGAGNDGAVRLLGAHIGGNFECDGASLRNESGSALYADGLQVDQSIFVRSGFTATGSGDLGTARLVRVVIGGHLDCAGASLDNNSGPALYGNSLRVGRGLFLSGGFTATGAGDEAVVVLTGAQVGGTLVVRAVSSSGVNPLLVAEVEAAGAVEGFLRGAHGQAGGQDLVLVLAAAG
jgi:hypothetical protein